jgi:hypothetical protein
VRIPENHALNLKDLMAKPGMLTGEIGSIYIDPEKKTLIIGWKVNALCSHFFNLKCLQNGFTKKCQFCKNSKEFSHIYFEDNNSSITIDGFTYKDGKAFQKISLYNQKIFSENSEIKKKLEIFCKTYLCHIYQKF